MAVGRAGWARSQPCALALAAALAVCAFYYLGGGGETFSTATRRLRATPASPARRGRALHLLVLFTKAERGPSLRDKARAALRSLLRHGRLGRGDALRLHLVTDRNSRDIAEGLLRDELGRAAFPHQVRRPRGLCGVGGASGKAHGAPPLKAAGVKLPHVKQGSGKWRGHRAVRRQVGTLLS